MGAANDQALLSRLAPLLAAVPGVRAVALGGSRARGTATFRSDYDIGLYYEAARPIDTEALGRLAKQIDDRGTVAEVTPIAGWGPWIDGGGWLTIGGARVDLLYRELGKVTAAIDDAHAGNVERYYQPGHPHAFLPTIYMGEVAHAVILYDDGVLKALQVRCHPYPPALARALRERFEWEAKFALENAVGGVTRNDVSYLAGCVFRSVACLCQTLHALNGVYLLNEKGAVAAADGFAKSPPDFARRIAAIYDSLNGAGLSELGNLIDEVKAL